jgi:ABC-type bacteriocin/lantibiotic exporter with double-glycine peptidase domain
MNLIGKTANSSLVVEMTQAEYDALKPVESPIQGEQPQLPVFPHISQNDANADDYKNDCGVACVAMAIAGLTDKKPTVNHLMQHYIAAESRGKYLSFAQLMNVLKAYGLKPHYSRPFKTEHIQMAVEIGSPCIVLIKYSALPKGLQSIPYTGSHFVLISEYDNESFKFHDPLAKKVQWINALDLHTAMSGFKPGENLPYQGMIVRK